MDAATDGLPVYKQRLCHGDDHEAARCVLVRTHHRVSVLLTRSLQIPAQYKQKLFDDSKVCGRQMEKKQEMLR